MDNNYAAMDLTLFDGAVGGEGAGAGAAAADAGGTATGAQGNAANRGKEQTVRYGKQAAGTPEAEQTKEAPKKAEPTPEERRKAFRALVSGEYRDIYTEETQRIIDKRFKETGALQERLNAQQGLLDTLAQRYGVEAGNLPALSEALDSDNAYWESKAEQMGMSVEQAKEFEKLRRNNAMFQRQQASQRQQQKVEAQAQQWYKESQEVKKNFPKFNLSEELKDREFLALLKAGTPMEHAYKVRHFDELMQDAMATTAAETEKRVADHVRSRGNRPPENGAAAQSGFVVKDDVTKLSKKDRAEIARRAARGERIIL